MKIFILLLACLCSTVQANEVTLKCSGIEDFDSERYGKGVRIVCDYTPNNTPDSIYVQLFSSTFAWDCFQIQFYKDGEKEPLYFCTGEGVEINRYIFNAREVFFLKEYPEKLKIKFCLKPSNKRANYKFMRRDLDEDLFFIKINEKQFTKKEIQWCDFRLWLDEIKGNVSKELQDKYPHYNFAVCGYSSPSDFLGNAEISIWEEVINKDEVIKEILELSRFYEIPVKINSDRSLYGYEN